ncbi:4503_t:CDS:1, partial [Ambispora leptoticha]
ELVRINRVLAIKHERIETDKDKKKFNEANSCWICKEKFIIDRDKVKCLENKISWLNKKLEDTLENSEDYKTLRKQIDKITKDINKAKSMNIKVWDHCHITGKFREAAHNTCNLELQIIAWKTPIPVVFHNFRGYDSHLVCESVGKSVNAHQIKVIAETFERYKSMKVGQLKYIDSKQFMNNSLANLTKNLGDNHPITSQHFKDYSSDQISLASHKGVHPYEYFDSQDRFLETELPPIHEFSTHLHGKISQKDYEHAQKVWKEFNCQNLGEYHDLYLKIDVLSLADIWTQFRKTCMQYYELDPSHYISAPALAWDAMLKMTGVKIELFTDMAMHDFIEKAKRGGIAMAGHRYFKANNPKIGKAFNPSKPTTWILYVDANNLYGWAMSQYLPIGNYQWEGRQGHFKNDPTF